MTWRNLKFCKDCKYYRAFDEHTKNSEPRTVHQCVYQYDMVTGKPKATNPYTFRQSVDVDACGNTGRHWEAKT